MATQVSTHDPDDWLAVVEQSADAVNAAVENNSATSTSQGGEILVLLYRDAVLTVLFSVWCRCYSQPLPQSISKHRERTYVDDSRSRKLGSISQSFDEFAHNQ